MTFHRLDFVLCLMFNTVVQSRKPCPFKNTPIFKYVHIMIFIFTGSLSANNEHEELSGR